MYVLVTVMLEEALLADAEQINIDDFPTLKKWEERMWARKAVQKGANVPDPYKMKELLADKEAMEKHAAQVSQLIVQQYKP